jgi:glycosyltransferase involved in cell wall biosynthesis
MMLSVLIATLENRREKFQYIFDRLTAQIRDSGTEGLVEVLYDRDNRERSLGSKRNYLIQQARGRFVAFVDDDDDVSGDYISRVCEAIHRRPDIDCIGIRGVITFRGNHPREFSHSLKYQDYFSRRHRYFRPPYHLNPILRSVALQHPFREINYSEDVEWALRLQRLGALKCEEFIDAPLYFYKSRRWWGYQLLLDWSEPARHALGLRVVNGLRLVSAPPRAE